MSKSTECTFWAVHDEDGAIVCDSDGRAEIYDHRQGAREACARLRDESEGNVVSVSRLTDDMDRLFVKAKP